MSLKNRSVTIKLADEDLNHVAKRAEAEDVSMSAVMRGLIRRDRKEHPIPDVDIAPIAGREARKPDRRAGTRRLDDKRRAALRRASP